MLFKRTHFCVLCLLLLFSLTSKAQKQTQFTTDTTRFIKDLSIYFADNSADKGKAADYINELEKAWKGNVIAGYYKEVAMDMANSMLEKRLKPFPFFVSYFNTMINFSVAKQSDENFENWKLCVDKIMKAKSTRGLQEFFAMSENIFKNNAFYKTAAYTYYSVEPAFNFVYDSIPVVKFKDITLVGVNPRGDSIAIEETEGTFYPTNGKFVGRGGKVSWERCGLDNGVFATLKRFTIDCKTGSYTSDSATFTGQQFFDKPQLGKLTDRIISEHGEKSFPRFDSYSKRLIVRNIYPDVDYDGGFGMRGAKFAGFGSTANPARIIFNYEDQQSKKEKKFLEVTAQSFGMGKDRIVANPATIKFFIGKDTIYHPAISFNYNVDKRVVTMLRGDDGLEKTPFSNSYHKFDMYFEQLEWGVDEPLMTFGFLPNNLQGEAFFESSDFYTAQKLNIIKGTENVSPVRQMIDYYNETKQTSFTVVNFSKYIRALANDMRPIIFKMAIYGLINYNPETDVISLRQRLFDYDLNAKHKHDYDIITLHSVNQGKPNATVSLLNFDMTVYGVDHVLLSDTQKVFMFPRQKKIVVKKNRHMDFSGTVSSGKFEFIGKDFSFDYDLFKIDMNTIDSIRIFVEAFEPDVNGNITYRKVQTMIENANGELRIDAPKNKSGWGKAPTFPSFKSFKESYAFYDRRETFKGVYNRNRFYFKLDPFSIDSLDNFRYERLRFGGTFSSAGIFPDFTETLTLQEDYSLGFKRQTPEEGYPVYGGKANYTSQIRLSNKGLRGSGDLKFSASLSKVPDLIFFPDSANGVASTYDVEENSAPEFPKIHGDTVRLHFMPYKEVLQAHSLKKAFAAYKERFAFRGRFDLTNQELTGKGKMDFEKADLVANKILFMKRKFYSDTADFHLKAFDDGESGLSFSTKNMNSKIDLDERIGDFVNNGEGSYVTFNKNQYIAFMDRFKWYMDAEELDLGDTKKTMDADAAEQGLDLEGPEFISIHPNQDSLRFYAPGAKYNVRKYIITCKNVPYIDVADARLFPKNGDVTIYKNAVIDTLKEAHILANTVTKYHTIRNVTANIFGRHNYLASGEYMYVDENEKKYLIKFQTIKPDATGQTTSEGVIPEEDNFKFNDYFSFAGKVFLQASLEFLTFNGGTKIVHNCDRIGKSYLKFTGEINPKDIQIPIPEKAEDITGSPVSSGLFYSADSNVVLSSFAAQHTARSARNTISEAHGVLTYDKETNLYEISNKEKLEERSLPGNYMSLNTENCMINSEGRYNLSSDLGSVKLISVGNAVYNPAKRDATFNLMMIVDFIFDNGLLKMMAKDFEMYLGSLSATPFEGDLFNRGIIELLGKDRGDKALSDLNLYGNFKKFPDEFEKSLMFNEVKMVYNPKAKAYISQGQLGLNNILKNEIFRYMNGVIQVRKQRGNDYLDIYLEADPNTWYYFVYGRGSMLAVSSNKEFNKALSELKPKNKKVSTEKGSYRFDLTSATKKTQFLSKLKQVGAYSEEDEEKKEDED